MSKNSLIALLFVFTAIATTFWGACSEREVFPIYDDDEIDRNLATSEAGMELFRTDDLISADPYVVPFDVGAIYIDILDSTRRVLNTWITPTYPEKEKDFGSLGVLRDAEYEVIDTLFVTTVRDSGGVVTSTKKSFALKRYGYFLKLGADGQRYNGWVLWGFNGGESRVSANMDARLQEGALIPADGRQYRPFTYTVTDTTFIVGEFDVDTTFTERTVSTLFDYARLTDMPDLTGDSIIVFEGEDYPNRSYFQLLSGFSNNGYALQQFDRSDSSHYLDTLRLANPNPHLYNVIFLYEIRRFFPTNAIPPDTMTLQHYGWCFPYRIPQ
jgi:hypothetical protein